MKEKSHHRWMRVTTAWFYVPLALCLLVGIFGSPGLPIWLLVLMGIGYCVVMFYFWDKSGI